jgi:hypothetical protein
MSWNTAAGCCGFDIFTRSTDGGQTFDVPMALFGNPIFGTNDVASNGTLYLGGISSNFSNFEILGSTNAQDPQATPAFDIGAIVDLGGAMGFTDEPNPAGLLGQLNINVDTSEGPTAGNVYTLCSVNPPGNDPMDVMFARSTDGGWTWIAPVRVNDDPPGSDSWQWFGTMSVAPQGRIDVIWNDTRNSGAANVSELFYAFSDDGGDTWSDNVALSPPWDSHLGWPNQNKIGDYYDMVSDRVGAHLAYAATFNGEHDVYYLRIGEYDCNDNGTPDPDDIAAETSFDCNDNGIPDECEIAAGTATDEDGDGVLDDCETCPWDCSGDDDGVVTTLDFFALIAEWGLVGSPCDLDGDGVDVVDFFELLANWGPC